MKFTNTTKNNSKKFSLPSHGQRSKYRSVLFGFHLNLNSDFTKYLTCVTFVIVRNAVVAWLQASVGLFTHTKQCLL